MIADTVIAFLTMYKLCFYILYINIIRFLKYIYINKNIRNFQAHFCQGTLQATESNWSLTAWSPKQNHLHCTEQIQTLKKHQIQQKVPLRQRRGEETSHLFPTMLQLRGALLASGISVIPAFPGAGPSLECFGHRCVREAQ